MDQEAVPGKTGMASFFAGKEDVAFLQISLEFLPYGVYSGVMCKAQ